MKTTTQSMLAVSSAMFTFITDEAASQFAPNKGGDVTAASKRETMDACHKFVESHRYISEDITRPVMVEELSDAGEIILVDSGEVETVTIERDLFAEAIQDVLKLRIDAVRTNSGAAKIKSLQDELAELKALLAAQGAKG